MVGLEDRRVASETGDEGSRKVSLGMLAVVGARVKGEVAKLVSWHGRRLGKAQSCWARG